MESLKLENGPLLKFLPDTVAYVRKAHNMDEDWLKQSVDILEEWIKKQSHFVKKDFDRLYLERCILTCKGSVEKSKKQIDRLCTLKFLVPKFFVTNNIRKNFEQLVDIVCIIPLPKLTKSHQRVFFLKGHDKEFTAAIFLDFYRYVIVLCEYLKAHDYTDGFIVIEDFRDVNMFEIMKKLNPIDIQQIMTVIIEGYGARIQGIHLFSRSKVMEVLVNTVKPLLSKKMADRIHICQENEELYSLVDKEILPIEYGGKERSMFDLQKLWLDALSSENFENYLTEMKEMRTNETFRQADKFNEHCIGLPGSFRTLSVD